jgi:KTSC domain
LERNRGGAGREEPKAKTADIQDEDATMKPIAVESTSLATVAYDTGRELLQIEFRDRAIYRYFRVPAEVHAALLRAPSKGSYFNRAIRGQFACARQH